MKSIYKQGITLLLLTAMTGRITAQHTYPTLGQVLYESPEMEKLLPRDSRLEVLAGGFIWTEGPVWSKALNSLLFSDAPKNTVFLWNEKDGLQDFLRPSGYTGKGAYSDEPGSNGLLIDYDGNLISCEHGDRRISIMSLKKGGKQTLADGYEGKRFNSPNDVAQHPGNRAYYFTDPPYGLEKKQDDPTRELSYCGVYRVKKGGEAELLVADLTRPNGIAFSPDGQKMYIAVSDPANAVIMSYEVSADGKAGKGKVLYDATPLVRKGWPGLPDGLKVDREGNLWTSGPGGILVLSPAGKLLGRIDTGRPTANCAWGDDGGTLYITAQGYLCRIRTGTKGANWK